jgi:hypothetical protein
MAAEVVGTAFVRIRALTTNLAKDIERGMEKGAKDADVDTSGAIVGDKFAKTAGAKIKSGLEDAVADTTKDIDKKVDVDGGRRVGDRLMEGIRSGLTRSLDGLGDFGGKIGDKLGLSQGAGDQAGRRFGTGLRGALLKIGLLFSPAILGAGSLLLQYVTALVGQLGFLITAAGGASVAVAGVFSSALIGIVPLLLAFKTETPRLKRFQTFAEKIGGAWKEVGAATQETLLPALTDALDLSTKLIPMFRAFGREVGRVAGAFAELTVANLIREQEKLREILQGSVEVIDSLSEVAFNFVSIFIDFFHSALPITQQFADALERMTDRWQNLIGESADSGRLAETLQVWYDRAVLVGGALGDLFAALWNIITVGATSSVPLFENFATWAQDFRDFTESAAGQNKLKQIFDDAFEVASAFNGLISDIARRIGAGVFEEGGNEGILAFIELLREDVVPFLDTTFRQVIADLGPALTEFGQAFGDFLTAFSEAGGLELAVVVLTQFLEVLTAILNIPGMDRFLGFLIGMTAAFGALKALGVVRLVSLLGSAIGTLAASMTAGGTATGIFGAGIAAGIGAIAAAAAIIAAIIAAIALLIIHWDKVKAAFAATVRFLKDPMARLEALKENIENLVGVLRQKLGQAAGIAGRALASMGRTIREKVEDAIGAVLEFLSELPGMAARALLRLGGALLGAISDALLAVARALPGLLGQLITFFVALPFRIFFALAGLGKKLLEVFLEALLTVGFGIATIGIPKLIEFFVALPGRIADGLSALGSTLSRVFTVAMQAVLTFMSQNIPKVVKFFTELPGKIATALANLPGQIASVFSTAFNRVKTAITDFITVTLPAFGSDMLTAGSNLIGELVKGLGKAISGTTDIAKDIVNGIIDFINKEVIDKINDLLELKIDPKIGPTVHINAPDIGHIPKLAGGGIFRKATQAIIGEKGAEVLIPLTNPRRALELFDQSGLAQVLARARQSAGGPTTAAALAGAAGGGLTIGHLELHAEDVRSVFREANTELRALARGVKRG